MAVMGGRGSNSSGGKSEAYKTAYDDELNNTNYRYLSFEAAINSTDDKAMQRQIMATEMRMHQDVKGESALKTMQDERDMIEQDIRDNHQMARNYGLSKETERGIRDALKEHKRRIQNVIGIMQESGKELNKQRFQLERNKGKKNWL